MSEKLLVRCADYNGYKDVLFMMDRGDFRLRDKRFSGNYTVVARGRYDSRRKVLEADGHVFNVFADWSLRESEGESDEVRAQERRRALAAHRSAEGL